MIFRIYCDAKPNPASVWIDLYQTKCKIIATLFDKKLLSIFTSIALHTQFIRLNVIIFVLTGHFICIHYMLKKVLTLYMILKTDI